MISPVSSKFWWRKSRKRFLFKRYKLLSTPKTIVLYCFFLYLSILDLYPSHFIVSLYDDTSFCTSVLVQNKVHTKKHQIKVHKRQHFPSVDLKGKDLEKEVFLTSLSTITLPSFPIVCPEKTQKKSLKKPVLYQKQCKTKKIIFWIQFSQIPGTGNGLWRSCRQSADCRFSTSDLSPTSFSKVRVAKFFINVT